eukprot:gnl/MRDRNA2_/MRDRNA2_150223_c0_seq1.p1 gnl/MRDRNA2_/MRDRNA2_150223_c0~~gnl/MRDRNA2_/MRDRNA2_150223_c0_seq1.p1  ORF type:complete len:1021 (+),score=158.83 gnl/MRDRNA2_/MRDRNA2_150223_c0_seq1:138-3200(+)
MNVMNSIKSFFGRKVHANQNALEEYGVATASSEYRPKRTPSLYSRLSMTSKRSMASTIGDLPKFRNTNKSAKSRVSLPSDKRDSKSSNPLATSVEDLEGEANEASKEEEAPNASDNQVGKPKSSSFFPRLNYDSIFGVDRDDPTPRVWGREVKSRRRLGDGMENVTSSESSQASNLARKRRSANGKLMLRDITVPFSYVDVFQSDFDEVEETVIRTFSIGAHILEHVKIYLSVWTTWACTAVCAFWNLESPSKEMMGLDGAMDVLYAIALALQLRTTVLDIEIGQESCKPSKIFYDHLVSRTFWFDVVSLVPMAVIVAAADGAQWGRWLMLVKGLRSWRLSREPPRTVFVSSNHFVMFNLLITLIIGGHLLACLWFTIVYEYTGTCPKHYELNGGETPVPYKGFWEYYFLSLNNGIYLLLGIERDAASTIEHAFLTLCVPIGAFAHAYVFGEIVLLIERRGMLDSIENEQTLAMQQAMRLLGLSPALQLRIIAYFTYERLRRNSRSCDIMLRRLSPQLRYEIHLCLYTDLVSDAALFQRTRPRVIRDIVTTLKDIVFLPGDNVCRFGEHGDSMYFIIDGFVTILRSDNETQVASLEVGGYFGEVALLTGVRRTAFVRAETFCLLAQLTKHDFEPIIRTYPEEIDMLIGEIRSRAERERIRAEALRHYGVSLKRHSNASTAGDHHQSRRDSRVSLGGFQRGFTADGMDAPDPSSARRFSTTSVDGHFRSSTNALESRIRNSANAETGSLAYDHSSSYTSRASANDPQGRISSSEIEARVPTGRQSAAEAEAQMASPRSGEAWAADDLQVKGQDTNAAVAAPATPSPKISSEAKVIRRSMKSPAKGFGGLSTRMRRTIEEGAALIGVSKSARDAKKRGSVPSNNYDSINQVLPGAVMSSSEIEAKVVQKMEEIEGVCSVLDEAVERVPRAAQDQVQMFNAVLADLRKDLFTEVKAELAPLKRQIPEMQAEILELCDRLLADRHGDRNSVSMGRRCATPERRGSYDDDDALNFLKQRSNVRRI